MSDPQSPTNRPASEPAPQSPPPKRNPVERVVVWGVIVVGLGLIAVQAKAWYSCRQSLERILEAVKATEASTELSNVTIDSLTPLLVGNPQESDEVQGHQGIRHYVWKGLVKDYGIHVRYGVQSRMVTEVLNDNPPPPEQRPVIETAEAPADAGDHGGPPMTPGEGGGPPGGGRPGFNPMQFDADGDGRLSRDEAPERMRAVFDQIDTNGDGFLDGEELAARRAQRGPGPGAPRSHDETGSRPPRPPAEGESSSPDAPAAAPPPDASPATNPPAETTPPDGAAPASSETTQTQ